MLKYHVRTDKDGCTFADLSDDSLAFIGYAETRMNLNPNTDYTVTITEGKPQRYPRYFVNKCADRYYYWRFDSPASQGIAVNYTGAESPAYPTLKNFLNNPDVIEVTREQAVAHIRGEPEPETCVWTRKEADNMWQVGCLRSGFGIQMAIGYRWCPFCRLQIEFRNPHQNPEENREPEPPDGYRVLEDWEVEVARELELLKPRDYYCEKFNYLNWLYSGHMFTSDTWDEKHYAVPQDFSVMPKCRDCGQQTVFKYREVKGERGWESWCFVGCSREDYDTCGRLCATKAEAVKAYPRK